MNNEEIQNQGVEEQEVEPQGQDTGTDQDQGEQSNDTEAVLEQL